SVFASCLRIADFHNAPHHLWKRVRIRLRLGELLDVVLASFPQSALLFESRSVGVDSRSFFFLSPAPSLLPPPSSCGRNFSSSLCGILCFHRQLSRLGWHFFLREPLLRFPYGAFHSWPRGLSRTLLATLPLKQSSVRHCRFCASTLGALELWLDDPMG